MEIFSFLQSIVISVSVIVVIYAHREFKNKK
ncbi:hypothetical protein IGJ91_001242 [Enterococcus sp. DIV0765f]